ncbi:MAG TPA: hypothetical protein VLQ93_06390, partial [Myxococcaceae bacterium]|nr:hypothetical protein [Myxococcaceae bacterium]
MAGCTSVEDTPDAQEALVEDTGSELRQRGALPTCGDLGGQFCDWGNDANARCDYGVSTSQTDGCPKCCGGTAPRTNVYSAASCGQLGGTACQLDDSPSGACGGKGPPSLFADGTLECLHCCGGTVNQNG